MSGLGAPPFTPPLPETAATTGTAYAVTVSETVGVVDDTTRVAAFARTVTEPVGVTDSVAVPVSQVTINDPADVTDNTLAVLDAARIIIDAVDVTDTVIDQLTVGTVTGDVWGVIPI